MNDSVLFAVTTLGMLAWLYLGVTEAYYNRCKRRKLIAEYKCAIDALSALSLRHEGYEKGMGACVCEEHRTARLVIRRYHEYGGKLNG